jgi:hypothetical protein
MLRQAQHDNEDDAVLTIKTIPCLRSDAPHHRSGHSERAERRMRESDVKT